MSESAKTQPEFKIGDTVYFDAGHIEKATILEFREFEGRPWASLHCTIIPGGCLQPLGNLRKAEQEVRDDRRAFAKKREDEYRNEITTVNDLVIFMFNHDVSDSEYGDTEARNVVTEKALELLGLTEEQLLRIKPDM